MNFQWNSTRQGPFQVTTNERHPMFHFYLNDKLVDNPEKPGKDLQLVNAFRIPKENMNI